MPLPTAPAEGSTDWYEDYIAIREAVDANEAAIDAISYAASASTGTMVKNGSNFEGYCSTHGLISTNTNGGTVLQALIDHVSNYVGNTGHRGGRIDLNVGEVLLTSRIQGRAVDIGDDVTSTTVWPIYLKGQGVLPRPAATSGEIGGTILRWNSGSQPAGTHQAVLDLSNDCHGYILEDFAIDGGLVASKCAVSAGRKIIWHRVGFRAMKTASWANSGNTASFDNTAGMGLFVTNGPDTTGDRYVQQRVLNCDFTNTNGGIALVIKSTNNEGSKATDGRIEDVQMNGCNSGGVYIGDGGWSLRGGHLTMNATGTASKSWGLWLDAGFLHIMNLYVDITPAGPNIKVTNNNFTIENCFLICNNKAASNAHPAISLGGSKGSVVGCIWGGDTGPFNYFVDRSNTQSAIVGCTGPTQSIGTSVVSNGSTNVIATFAY